MTQSLDYQIEEGIPAVADYCQIRVACGLSPKSPEAASIGLKNTVFGVCLKHQGRIIGMGRIIGDGGCFFQIVDIAVLPEHQKKGLGALIIETLVEHAKTSLPKTAYISLIADPGTPPFYQRFGFTPCPPGGGGMFMKIL
jgi:GNAT superfamily N-acetyltransferase